MSVEKICSGQDFFACRSSSISSSAIEYASSPVAQPGIQTRIGSSVSLRATIGAIAWALELLPRVRIAEETRDVDQQIARERLDLLRVFLEMRHVLVQAADAPQRRAAADAPEQRRFLVGAEIAVALRPQQLQQPAQVLEILRRDCSSASASASRLVMRRQRARESCERANLFANTSGRHDEVDGAGLDRALRHAVVVGGAGSCTITRPPASFTAFTPSAPSVPVPERMTATAFSR